jgi:outer membrane receptor protein involved in Fe transport
MSLRATPSGQVSRLRVRPIASALLAILAAAPGLAPAQDEIIVTGSRVSREGFDSPQPLTTINAEQIENLGIVNVGEVVRTIPQNTPFFTETNVGFGNFNVGAQLANLRGLNPFFGTRTLTLVDTKRVVGTTEGGAVDLSLIPSMLVGRTEVVTGGASAAYGSDAIAGVVNVILDRTLDGFRAQVDYGETAEGDGGDTHASVAWGTPFADDDRGHVLLGAEWQKQDLIGPCSKNRDWCQEAWGTFTNSSTVVPDFDTPAGVGNGLPNFVVLPNGKFPTSDTGVLTTAGVPRQFDNTGTQLLPYNPGQFPGAFSRYGGDGSLLAYDLSSIRPEIERYSVLGHVDFELSDGLDFFAEVATAHSESLNTPANGALGPFIAGGQVIAPDNAFLEPVIGTVPTGGTFARVFLPGVISAHNTTENTTTRFVTGLEGELGSKWDWDVYYQHGENENHQRLFHNAVNGGTMPFLSWAIDSVRSAGPGSPIVCRQTLLGNPNAAGCVPLNIFGNTNANPAAVEYAFRTLKEDSTNKQDVVALNFRSTIAEGWAGPIGLATGIEMRTEQNDTTHDIPNQPWYSSYVLSYGLDRGGDIDVLDIYGELDVPMTEKFHTNFAARQTQNEATSNQTTVPSNDNDFVSWKVAALYDPLDWLRFRGTLSHDVRAAGFRELFLPRVDAVGTPGGFPAGINNPWAGNAPEQYLNISGGNPALNPEEADTTTFGAVFSFERFRFSADWFEIDLEGAITPGGAGGAQAQALVNSCFTSGGTNAPVCERVIGAGTANIVSVDTRSINIGKFLSRGWDYEASFDFPMGAGGNLNLRVIGTYLYEMLIDAGLGAPPVDYRNQSGPVASFGGFNTQPDWQARAWLTYSRERFTTTLETRYVGSARLNAVWFDSPPGQASNRTPFSVSDNSVDDAYYLSWSGSFDFVQNDDRGTQLFWAINNLLDEDPPVAPGGNVYPTNPVFFDTLGQRVRVGVRLAF